MLMEWKYLEKSKNTTLHYKKGVDRSLKTKNIQICIWDLEALKEKTLQWQVD